MMSDPEGDAGSGRDDHTPVIRARPGRRVLILQRRLTEYRVPFFEALRGELAARGIRLTVVHGTAAAREESRRDAGSLPWALSVRTRYLRIGAFELSWTPVPREVLVQQDLFVLPHENMFLQSWRLLGWVRRVGIAWWGHGPKLTGPRRTIAERLKGFSARAGDWYLAYTGFSVERVLAAGVPLARITNVENAVALPPRAPTGDATWDADRALMRDRLQLGEAPVAVYLGALTVEKRIPMMLAAADALRQRIPDLRLLVIGDGPLRSIVERAAATRPWVSYLGALHGRDKAIACSFARALLNPGMVGLNIVDAFALGVPLVTMRHQLHSPEVAYLIHGENGLMSEDCLESFVKQAHELLMDEHLAARLRAGCMQSAERYTVGRMAHRFAEGIEGALRTRSRTLPTAAAPLFTVAYVVRTFLPYHVARLRRLVEVLQPSGVRVVGVEVASGDGAYAFPAGSGAGERVCCFAGADYQSLTVAQIRARVLEVLEAIQPDIVFGHATPFPEGMAGIEYRNRSAARVFVMDDAWGHTDRSSTIVRRVKRLIHASVDGALVPARLHAEHQAALGIPRDRIFLGVDAVDNAYFGRRGDAARERAAEVRARLDLPEQFFLFVGRFLERKGIRDLLGAYERYRRGTAHPWRLVLVGGNAGDIGAGPGSADATAGVTFLGRMFGAELAEVMGLAGALVVPSREEPWGLVVNEAMAAGTVPIVSLGCGAAELVRDGVTGFTFAPGDVAALSATLARVAGLPAEARDRIGRAARESISEWGLDRFVAGVKGAFQVPRRPPASRVAAAAAQLWRGRVRAY